MGASYSLLSIEELQRIWLQVCYAERPGLNARTAVQQRLGEPEFVRFWLAVEQAAGKKLLESKGNQKKILAASPTETQGPKSLLPEPPPKSLAGEHFARGIFRASGLGTISWNKFLEHWHHRQSLSKEGYPDLPWMSLQ